MPSPSRETAERWNRKLRGFGFYFAHGGHANDMDYITGGVRFSGEEGLLDLFARWELPLRRITPGEPLREPGRSYTPQEWRVLPEPIRGYPAYAQPGFTVLFGAPVNLSVHSNSVSIMVTGAKGFSWDVFEADFRNAVMLEEAFARRGIEFITY